MICWNIKFIRDNIDDVKENCSNRNVSVDLNRLLALDDERRSNIQAVEDIRRQQNEIAKAMKGKLEQLERNRLIAEGKRQKEEAVAVDATLKRVQGELNELIRRVPNMTHPDSPVASGEEGNREIRRWGEPTKFDFKPMDHVQLGEKLDPH